MYYLLLIHLSNIPVTEMAPWNSGSSVRFMMFSVFPGASRYMLETMPNRKLRLFHLTFFFTHQKQRNFFSWTHALNSHYITEQRTPEMHKFCMPMHPGKWVLYLTLSAQLLQFFPLTHKLCTMTRAPSIKEPCNTKVYNSLQKCGPENGACFMSPFWHL